jgi:hypothetical protein
LVYEDPRPWGAFLTDKLVAYVVPSRNSKSNACFFQVRAHHMGCVRIYCTLLRYGIVLQMKY